MLEIGMGRFGEESKFVCQCMLIFTERGTFLRKNHLVRLQNFPKN